MCSHWFVCALRLTVQDDSHQRLVVLVEDLPEGEGLLRSVGQQPEQQGDGVVRGQPFRVEVPVSHNTNILWSLLISIHGLWTQSVLSYRYQSSSFICSIQAAVSSDVWNTALRNVNMCAYLVGCARKASLCRWKQGKVLKVPGTMETPETLLYRFSTSPNSSIMRKPDDSRGQLHKSTAATNWWFNTLNRRGQSRFHRISLTNQPVDTVIVGLSFIWDFSSELQLWHHHKSITAGYQSFWWSLSGWLVRRIT